ncbi:7850_t:CDS:2, partial [Funneliformis mosseae]
RNWSVDLVRDFLKSKQTEFALTDDEILRSFIFLGPALNIAASVTQLNNQRLLTINEDLLCIPPPANYPLDTSTSISSTIVYGAWPTKIARWNEFLTEVNRYNFFEQEIFKRPQFFHGVQIVVETNVYTAMEVNIFGVLNEVMKKYMFAKQKDSDFSRNDPNIGPFVPDYTCRLKINDTFMKKILALEIKRDILLRDLVGLTDEKLESFTAKSTKFGGGQIPRSLNNSRYNLRVCRERLAMGKPEGLTDANSMGKQ